MDTALIQFFISFHGRVGALDAFAAIVATSFLYILVLAFGAACVVLFSKDPLRPLRAGKERLHFIFTTLLALLLARGVVVSFIRFIYPVTRPFAALTFTPLIKHAAGDPSFPSGHAVVLFVLAAAVWGVNKKWGIYMFAGAALNAGARVYSGVHWPSDVLVGAIIGCAAVWLVRRYATLDE